MSALPAMICRNVFRYDTFDELSDYKKSKLAWLGLALPCLSYSTPFSENGLSSLYRPRTARTAILSFSHGEPHGAWAL